MIKGNETLKGRHLPVGKGRRKERRKTE